MVFNDEHACTGDGCTGCGTGDETPVVEGAAEAAPEAATEGGDSDM